MGRSCFGKLVMAYPGPNKFTVGGCDGKLAVGLCWKGEKYSGRGNLSRGLMTPLLSHALNPQKLCDLCGCCQVFAFGPCWLDDHRVTQTTAVRKASRHCPASSTFCPAFQHTVSSIQFLLSTPNLHLLFSNASQATYSTSLACSSSLESLMKPQSLMF